MGSLDSRGACAILQPEPFPCLPRASGCHVLCSHYPILSPGGDTQRCVGRPPGDRQGLGHTSTAKEASRAPAALSERMAQAVLGEETAAGPSVDSEPDL